MAKSVKKSAEKASSSQSAMVDHHANAMDYKEHEKTYDLFLWLSRWTVVGCVALLIAMMVGFYAGGGFWGGLLVFVVLMIAAFFVV